jgi:hypothetical protein
MRRPAHYEIEIAGHLDDIWQTWFGNLQLTRTPAGNTILSGPLADQPALHGLLNKIRDLGLTLLSVRQVGGPQGGPAAYGK